MAARDMAGVFVASLVPAVLLGPAAGVFADRWDPRRTMIASDIGRGVLILLLTRAASLPQIYAISFSISCLSSFFAPAHAIVVPLLVPRERLLAANASMQQSMQLVRLASPALAGALVAEFGERVCYTADSVSFFLSAWLLATLRCERLAARMHSRFVVSDLAAGIGFLRRNSRFSLVVLSMTAGTFSAGCFGALAPLYVRDILRCGPSVLGMIGSLIAAGTLTGSALLGSAWQSSFVRKRDLRQSIGGGMGAVGASVMLIAAVPTRAAALVGSAGMGLGVAVVTISATAMLQSETPAGLRGRVSGASASLASLAQLAALMLSGGFAARLGIRGVFASAPCFCWQPGRAVFSRALNPKYPGRRK